MRNHLAAATRLFLFTGLLFAAHPAPAATPALQPVALSDAGASSYRTDAARHIYATYAASIYHGMLPPLVHAIVVVEAEVDARGYVQGVHVIRSPSHAPEVADDVQRLIRRASPFPAPGGRSGARFTETWLVDDSGRFQLHALTEGQR